MIHFVKVFEDYLEVREMNTNFVNEYNFFLFVI